MNKNKIIGILFIILGVLVFLTPGTLAPVCPAMADGKFMKCHWMGQAIKGIGGVMTVLGLIYTLICSKKQMFFTLAISNVVIGIYAILLPAKLIGGCMNAEMACRAKTMPMIYILVGLYIVISVVAAILNRSCNESNQCK
ncbi:DUF4418 family protein [Fenollaria sporofastidiosus]|uniref:DUF4418 family protein n=1 Tax=Fenollaria sporofastidiosus TaxID=2811778 RepID=UPI001C003B7A|nr:DUF4418 family protein [Fenollaria sporofastidiosus]